jgi:hypothetical protein
MGRFFGWIGNALGASLGGSFLAWLLPVAALVLGASLGGWGAWQLGRAPLLTDIADLKAGHAAQMLTAQQAGERRLREAQAVSDALGARLGDLLAANDQLTQEKTRALQTATAGRTCLSERALRLLDGAPGITVARAAGVPAPRSGAAAPGAAAAAPADLGGRTATDTDVASWIALAGNRFEVCRQRLDALIAWHARPPTESLPKP